MRVEESDAAIKRESRWVRVASGTSGGRWQVERRLAEPVQPAGLPQETGQTLGPQLQAPGLRPPAVEQPALPRLNRNARHSSPDPVSVCKEGWVGAAHVVQQRHTQDRGRGTLPDVQRLPAHVRIDPGPAAGVNQGPKCADWGWTQPEWHTPVHLRRLAGLRVWTQLAQAQQPQRQLGLHEEAADHFSRRVDPTHGQGRTRDGGQPADSQRLGIQVPRLAVSPQEGIGPPQHTRIHDGLFLQRHPKVRSPQTVFAIQNESAPQQEDKNPEWVPKTSLEPCQPQPQLQNQSL